MPNSAIRGALLATLLRSQWANLITLMFNNLPELNQRRCCYVTWLTGPRLLCSFLHNPVDASQRVLNLGTIGDLPGGEFVSAQTAGQIGPKVKFPQPDLEQLLAVGTGQIDPCAPVILEHAALSG
jgi:hypothetical protein